MMDTRIIGSLCEGVGCVGWGVVGCEGVTSEEAGLYDAWVAEGKCGEMGYLASWPEVRREPGRLLEGARSIICAAFNYYNPENRGPGGLRWARYALGADYHDEVRRRLTQVAERIKAETGAECRVCVDTAPLRERLWAARAGVGFIGRNGLLIVPGAGSWCVLGFIVTTLGLEPTAPLDVQGCEGCDRCVRACPGGALDGCGGMDARRCRSYLTIEYRGEEIPHLGGGRVYGCDICQEVCPHNRAARRTEIEAFSPRKGVLALTREDILGMEQGEFSALFKGSAIKRTKLAGLRRNAAATEVGEGDHGGDAEAGDNLGEGER